MGKQAIIDKEHRHSEYTLYRDKLIWVAVFVLLQIGFYFFAYLKLRENYFWIQGALAILSLLVVVYIINRPINPAYKLAWCITILVIPLFGGALYILLSANTTRRLFRKSIRDAVEESKRHFTQNPAILEELNEVSMYSTPQAQYIYNLAKYPVYKNSIPTYLGSGEEFFLRLVDELKQAKHFIFMEYFIIHEGGFWDTVLDILKQKVKEGVEVKIIYDDMGSVQTLPHNYAMELQKYGIECRAFNPFNATLTLRWNNRDHRKITVIDGHTAFTGGINLADEYINQRKKINGHWKDTGIMIKGEAVWNFTVMFLQFWKHLTKTSIDYEKYHLQPSDYLKSVNGHSDGYIQPYADNPLYSEEVAENVYLNMIHRATKYVYITTPYLIVDNEMITALTLAAQSGVDVRIITPHIPDKKGVFTITRSFYEPLTKAGVKIYEYTPGFIHSKMMVTDDNYCVVGSINLDYRSLYLHFECATILYHCKEILTIKKDIEDTITVSKAITYEDCLKLNAPHRLWLSLVRLYAPLL